MKKQNVKTVISISLLFAIVLTAKAVIESSFSSWGFLIQNSPDIIIAHCTRTPNPDRDQGSGPTGTLVYSDIDVISNLKGATNWGTGSLEMPKIGASRLISDFWTRQGEYYLVFSVFHDGEYQASENYRVVPLGLTFYTNSLSGKTLDEQIQALFQRRLNDLDRQMKQGREEKQRLEEGIKK